MTQFNLYRVPVKNSKNGTTFFVFYLVDENNNVIRINSNRYPKTDSNGVVIGYSDNSNVLKIVATPIESVEDIKYKK